MKTIQEIDLAKHGIELKYIPSLRKIFRHMAADTKALYLAMGRIPTEQLTKNYSPEFLKVIRDAQRETIKVFGFDIREDSEGKGYAFKTMKYKGLFDYHVETKDIDPINNVEAVEKVNRAFALEAALFVANISEEQVAYIDKTNEKEINEAENLAVILFFQEQSQLRENIFDIENEIRQLEFNAMIGGSEAISAAKKKKLLEKLEINKQALDDLVKSKDQFIANNIEKNLIARGETRSPLIASQNVGMAEAWSRQKEAELIESNVPEIQLKKRWEAILDSRTRPSHAVADGQEVGVNENFIVGGYPAKTPRAENLPPEESMNCRCVAIYSTQSTQLF